MDIHLHMHDDVKIDLILARLAQLLDQGAHLMASVQELKDELVEVKDGVAALKANGIAKVEALQAEVADLKAQLAAGTAVTQADLDSLDAQIDDINATLNSDGAPVDPPVDPSI